MNKTLLFCAALLPLALAVTQAGAESDPVLIIQPETETVLSSAQKCRDNAAQYEQAVRSGMRDISRLTGQTVTFSGSTIDLLPLIAGKLDLLGRHEMAEKVRDRASSLEFHRLGVCTFA